MNIDNVMAAMPVDWRYRWCEAGPCACLGAANCSGLLRELGATKEEWQAWVDAHPKPPEPVAQPINPNKLDPNRIPK